MLPLYNCCLEVNALGGKCSKDFPSTANIIKTLNDLQKQHHLPESTINMKFSSQLKTLFDTTHCDITFNITSKQLT